MEMYSFLHEEVLGMMGSFPEKISAHL
jgi:hypothetical protein